MAILESVRKKAFAQSFTLLANLEGFRAKAYRNSVKEPWTVGYGFTTLASGAPVTQDTTMTKQYADSFLTYQMQGRLGNILGCIVEKQHPNLTANMLTALVSLHHNIGPTQFRTSTVVRDINLGLYPEAAKAFLLWHRGNEENDLLPRREREMKLFLTPDSK